MVHVWTKMSAAPDPAELAPSRDLAAYGRRRLITPALFAWLVACVLCVMAGVAIGRFALAPAAPAAKPQPSALESPRSAPTNPTLAAVAPAPATATAPEIVSDNDTALTARVGKLEAAASHAGAAAAQALGAAVLSQASQGSAPFEADVAAYQRLAPGDSNLIALAPLAARGAPSRATLAAALPDLLAQASVAARHPAKDSSLLAKLASLLSRVVIVRHVDPAAPGVDGVLARAEGAADAGDLEIAVADLETLPPVAKAPLEPWLAAAQRRLEIDRRIEALRGDALATLVGSQGARS